MTRQAKEEAHQLTYELAPPPHNEIHMDRPIHISINICKAPLPSKQSAMTFPTARPSDVLQHFALLQFEEVA
jgi:hypothetical protein